MTSVFIPFFYNRFNKKQKFKKQQKSNKYNKKKIMKIQQQNMYSQNDDQYPRPTLQESWKKKNK